MQINISKKEKIKLKDELKNIDDLTIAGTDFDRRRKLNTEERKQAKKMHEEGYSLREIARFYGVSHMTIKYIVNPKVYEKHLEQKREKNQLYNYYDKERQYKALKDLRLYKKELLRSGSNSGKKCED